MRVNDNGDLEFDDREEAADFANETGEVVESQITDQSRWSTYHRVILKHAGAYYRANFSTGSTEYQYEGPYEYEALPIIMKRVVPVEVTTIQYKLP